MRSVRDDLDSAERTLLDVAREQTAEMAGRAWGGEKKEACLVEVIPEPRVTLELSAPARVHLLLRLPILAHGEGRRAQDILRRFLTEFYGTESDRGPARQ